MDLRKLTLILPCHFFNQESIYDVINKSKGSLKDLSLELTLVNPDSILNGNVLLEGLCKIIKKCCPMDHLNIHISCMYSDKLEPPLIKAVFCSVISFQNSLKSFSFKSGSTIQSADRELIIKSLPSYKIDIDQFSEWFLDR